MDPVQAHNKLLKGGEFIIKDVEAADVFIPEDFNEEQKMIRQMCRDFVNEIRDRSHLLEAQVELLDKTGKLGLLSSHMPEQYGGMALDTNTNTLIIEELGKTSGSYDTSMAAHTGIGMLPILYYGTDEQKEKYLPRLGTGELKSAYCLTEPGSGSDALAARTRADLTEDGEAYLLNGQKMWISNAGFADLFIVFVKIDGEHFSGFIVDAKTPGITLGEEEHKLGIKGSSTRQVFFENARVPKENLLGEIGRGHLIAFNALNIGRFKLGAMTMGGCKVALDEAIRYANERHQFGQPISNFGAMQFKLAEQALRTYMLESAVYRVSDLMQNHKLRAEKEGKSFGQSKLEAAKEYASECAIIKIAGSEILDFVLDEALQIFGGYGYSEEYPIAMPYRDARINRIYEGTNEINRLLMVDQILKRAFKGKIDIVGPAWAVQKELTQMPSLHRPTAEEIDRKTIKDFKKILLMVAGAAAKYQMDGHINLREEQEIIMNIADIAIEVFLLESLLLRVEKLQQNDYAGDPDIQIAMLKLAIHDGQSKIIKWGTDALASFAKGDELTIMLKGLKRFSKYPVVNVRDQRRKIASYLIARNKYDL